MKSLSGKVHRMEQELIAPSLAARLLGVSSQHIRTLARSGQINCIRYSTGARDGYLFSRKDIEELAAARKGKQHDSPASTA